MPRGGAKDVTSYSIRCQDCAVSWSGDSGWVSAYSAAQRHATTMGHKLHIYQGRTWFLGSSDNSREA